MLRNALKLTDDTINKTSLPLGSIIPYFREDQPDGFLICDGRSCSGYELEDMMTNVPDLRGKFIRMIGGNADKFGVIQNDAIRNISGSVSALYAELKDDRCSGAFYINNVETKYNDNAWTGDLFYGGFIFDASRVVPTAEENRPVNIAMNYIIYAGGKKSSHS